MNYEETRNTQTHYLNEVMKDSHRETRLTLSPTKRVKQLAKGSILIALWPFLCLPVSDGQNVLASVFTFVFCLSAFVLIDLVFGGDLNHAFRARYATKIAKVKKALRDPDFHALVTFPAVILAVVLTMIAMAIQA